MTNEDKVAEDIIKRNNEAMSEDGDRDQSDYDVKTLLGILSEKDKEISDLTKALHSEGKLECESVEMIFDPKATASVVKGLEEALAEKDNKIAELEQKCKNLDKVIGSLDVKNPDACDALLNVQLTNMEKIKELEQKVAELEKDKMTAVNVGLANEIELGGLKAQCSKMRVALETAYHGIRAFASYGRGASLGFNGIDEPNLQRAHSACEQALSEGVVE